MSQCFLKFGSLKFHSSLLLLLLLLFLTCGILESNLEYQAYRLVVYLSIESSH